MDGHQMTRSDEVRPGEVTDEELEELDRRLRKRYGNLGWTTDQMLLEWIRMIDKNRND